MDMNLGEKWMWSVDMQTESDSDKMYLYNPYKIQILTCLCLIFHNWRCIPFRIVWSTLRNLHVSNTQCGPHDI